MAAPNSDLENDNVFLENTDTPSAAMKDDPPDLPGDTIMHLNVCSMLDPAGSSSSSNSRKPSYDSRESKSISECSYVSGSPCESPLQDMQPIGMATQYCSTYTMEYDGGHQTLSSIDPFESEKNFIDYLMSLPSSKTDSNITLPSTSYVTPPAEMASLKPQTSTTVLGSQSPKIGLDHLENLCKLMEQLGELREQNFKLQKRVQYLEEVRCLNEMRRDLKAALLSNAANATTPPSSRAEEQSGDLDFCLESTGTTQPNTRGSSFYESKGFKRKESSRPPSMEVQSIIEVAPVTSHEQKRSKDQVKSRKSSTKQQRSRSQSMGDDNHYHQSNHSGRKAKVSKWTKVKEALKWERVQVDQRGFPGGSDAKSSFFVSYDEQQLQQPTITSKATFTPTPTKSERYMQSEELMSYSETPQKHQKRPSGKSRKTDQSKETIAWPEDTKEALTTPQLIHEIYLETSSDDEVDTMEHLAIKDRKGRSLERDSPHGKLLVRYTQSDKECKKLSKGAWGKVKNIIQTRKDSLKRKHRKSGSETECKSGIETDFSSADLSAAGEDTVMEAYEIPGYGYVGFEEALGVPQQTIYDQAYTKSKHSSSSSNYGGEDFGIENLTEKPKVKKNKPHQLTIQVPPEEASMAKAKVKTPGTTPPTFNIITSNYSPNSQRKSKWTKVKKVFLNKRDVEMALSSQRPQSVPASPTNLTSFTYEDLGLLEEYLLDARDWVEKKEHLSGDNENYECSVAVLQNIIGDKLENDPVPMSTEAKKNLEEMQRNLSQDFSRKMQEWEKLKTNYAKQQTAMLGPCQPTQQQSPKLDRKGSAQKNRKGKAEKGKEKGDREQKGLKQREKELQWLEKQLQKIEREKQRLSKERQKYLEREARLEKMKESMMKPADKKEILIRTSAGEFRFEGISQTFTRKLYEWEEMKGIGPEVSTIALLDGNSPVGHKPDTDKEFSCLQTTLCTLSPPVMKYGHLDRLRSRSESSIADIVNVQTSTTSLAPDDLVDDVFTDGPPQSRANSEPDMSFHLIAEEQPCAMVVEEMHFEESIPCLEIPAIPIEEPIYSYAPAEVTHLIDSSGSSDAEKDLGEGLARTSLGIQNSSSQVTILEEESAAFQSGKEAHCETLLEEDLRLLESLTAKEEMCRQLENDLVNLDGRMKMIFQQHAEEIQKLTSQEDNSEENREMINNAPITATVPHSPTSDTIRQKQLIENLQIRIKELEKAGEILKKEREDIEKTFRINSEQQAQLTQNLAARINEMQQRSRRKRSSNKTSGEGQSIRFRKREAVLKVQELSAELLHQAKTLEQALLERNATIRQLQWELLQRDMSAIHIHNELQKVKEKTDGVVSGNECRKKGNHNRSWSSADAASTSCSGPNERQILNIQKYSDNPELIVRPEELTQKVRELKTELMRLWSSNESTTSFSSEIGNEELRMATKQETDESTTMNKSSIFFPMEQSTVQLCELKGNNGKIIGLNQTATVVKTDKLKKLQEKSFDSVTAAFSKPNAYNEATVTARRVSDTSVPYDLPVTLDLHRERHKNTPPSKLPRTPEMKKHEQKKINSSFGNSGRSTSQEMGFVDPTLSPPVLEHESFEMPLSHYSDVGCHGNKMVFLHNTHATEPQQSNDLCHKNNSIGNTSKLIMELDFSSSPSRYLEVDEIASISKGKIASESEIEPNLRKTPLSTDNQSTSKHTITAIGIPSKSECLPFPRKHSLVKDSKSGQLQRQNAEDIDSTSDTDTEGSGITFMVGSEEHKHKKLKDIGRSGYNTTVLEAKLPVPQNAKKNESTSLMNESNNLPVSQQASLTFGSVSESLSQSPSSAPWRTGQSKLPSQKRISNEENGHKQEVTVGQMPLFTGTLCSSTNLRSTPSKYENPETAVAKSGSNRKIKVSKNGKPDDTSTTSSFMNNASKKVHKSNPVMLGVQLRMTKEAAPNVKMMIEKYNKKLAEEKPITPFVRSPHMGSYQNRNAIGIQKSTSFTDPSANEQQASSKAAESVLKSASASNIEEVNLRHSVTHSTQKSEIPAKQASFVGQPIGTASRIPRCLRAITEQESKETSKDDTSPEIEDITDKKTSNITAPSLTNSKGCSITASNHKTRPESLSPKAGMRAIEIRRARDEFLTKLPVPCVPCTEQRPDSHLRDLTVSPSPSSPKVGWKSVSCRSSQSTSSSIVTESSLSKAQLEVIGSLSDDPKLKGILKSSSKGALGAVEQNVKEVPESTRIIKSASAGAMDDSKTILCLTDAVPLEDGSKISDSHQTSQKSGLFHFKFRKAKMKQKKEPLNAVKALCRQSLLVDIQPTGDYDNQQTSSVSTRSCPSSPDLHPRPIGKAGWLTKPRTLFKSK